MSVAVYTPQYVQIKKILKGMFATHESGSKVATENELTKKIGVSKHTVRRTLSLLEEEGMLERKQGSGTYIQQKNNHHLRKIVIFVHDYLAIHDYYQGVIMSEIGEAALELGARTHLYPIRHHDIGGNSHSLLARMLKKGEIDGVIVRSPLTEKAILFLEDTGVPFVMADNHYFGARFPTVLADDFKTIHLAYEYLVEQKGRNSVGAILLDTSQSLGLEKGDIPS